MKPALDIAVLPVYLIFMVILIFPLQSKTGNAARGPHEKENEGFQYSLEVKCLLSKVGAWVWSSARKGKHYQAGTHRPFPPSESLPWGTEGLTCRLCREIRFWLPVGDTVHISHDEQLDCTIDLFFSANVQSV